MELFERFLPVLSVYLFIGFIIALIVTVVDPQNRKGRITRQRGLLVRFLIITTCWIAGWERNRDEIRKGWK
jgi:hypothetical protein